MVVAGFQCALPVNCLPIAPSASSALGLSSPMPAVAGVVVAEDFPVPRCWEDIVGLVMILQFRGDVMRLKARLKPANGLSFEG